MANNFDFNGKLLINSNGNVLIGTTTDGGYKLDVAGQLRSLSGTALVVSMSSAVNNDAVVAARWTGGTGMEMKYHPNSAVGYLDNTYEATAGQVYGDIYLRQNVAGTMTTRLAIKADGGNVGIGTTTPLGPLEVYRSASGALGGHIVINNNGSAVANETALMFGDGGINGIRAAISSTTENSPYYGDIKFKTGASVYSSLTTQMMIKGGGNVLIGTTTDVGAKLYVDGGIRASSSLTSGGLLEFTGAWSASPYNGSAWVRPPAGVGVFLVNNAISRWAGFKPNDDFVVNSDKLLVQSSTGFVGIGTDSPTRSLQVVGTTRHERVYAYANNVLAIPNSVSSGTVWVHLGTQGSFTTDKIYYRVGTNTSEEEGEIIIKNTCSLPNIEWFRNSYNVMVTAVKARMQGGCQPCEIWIQVRYGSDYGGTNTTLQWQVHSGTDGNFATVNATGTPGTGTNEANISSTDGYMVSTSNNQSVGGNLGVGTTAPNQRLSVEGGNFAFNSNNAAANYYVYLNKKTGQDGGILFNRDNGNDWQLTNGASNGDLIFYSYGTSNEAITLKKGTGNVLIGTTTDNGDKLHVAGNTTINGSLYLRGGSRYIVGDGGDLYIDTENVAGRDLLLQTQSGQNVGINTTTPSTKLEVNGGTIGNSIARFTTGAASGGTRGVTITSNDSQVKLQVSDNAGSIGSWAFLNLNPDGGNVGIGTTAPASLLQVVGASVEGQGVLNVSNTHAAGNVYYPAAKIRNTRGDHSYGIISEFSVGSVGGTDRPSILFYSDAAAASWTVGQVTAAWGLGDSFGIGYRASNTPSSFNAWPTNYFGITTGGNVLIGTTTDGGYKLRVNGEILADDDIRILNTFALVLNGTDNNWRIGRNTITDSGWLTSNTLQVVVFGSSSGQGFQVVNSNGTALFEIDGVAGASRFTNALGVGVNPSGTAGRIDASNDIVAYSSSDLRLKENIKPIENALDKVKALTGVEFDWKAEHKEAHGYEGHDTGVIAQEVQEVMPMAVRTNDTGYLAVRYEKLIGLLIEANKELANRVEYLESKLK